MDKASSYWQLVRLDSAGRCQMRLLPDLQAWVKQTCADLLQESPASDSALQAQLLRLARSETAEAAQAQLALRCFITHQIRRVCIQLEQQFGDRYGFSRDDLFPLVLDDDGRSGGPYQPLTGHILETYDPRKAGLSTWTDRLVRNHSEINRFFLERGLYRASDWAILNDTKPEQLERVLAEHHGCGGSEIERAKHLLDQYHRVYRGHRLRQRQAGRCQPPTEAQLQQMVPEVPARTTLARLQALAGLLREYRIIARGGIPYPKLVSLDAQETEAIEHHITGLGAAESDPEEEAESQSPKQFLQTYRTELRTCLETALTEVLRTQTAKLQKRKPPKDQAFVRGLQLFHCEGLGMKAIAPQIDLKTQVQVTRLLDLNGLRTDVRLVLLPQLQRNVRDQALRFTSVERLKQIDQTLDQLLTEEVDRVMEAAASEAKIPKGRTARSLFAHHLCQTIHQFIESHD